MATVTTFEELEIWVKARVLTNNIYLLTKMPEFKTDFVLRDQMRKSAISIMSNIAEGFERSGNKEFIHFLFIAKGSAGELLSQLVIASDQKMISIIEFENLTMELKAQMLQVGKLISYLKNSEFKGSRFKK